MGGKSDLAMAILFQCPICSNVQQVRSIIHGSLGIKLGMDNQELENLVNEPGNCKPCLNCHNQVRYKLVRNKSIR